MSTVAHSEEIPFTVEPRPDTGLYNAKLGIWLFLASEVMLFGALFSSYIMLRVGSEEWPSGLLNVALGTVNTFFLATSTITTIMAWLSLKIGEFGKFKRYQAATLLLAAAFLSVKSVEYHDKFTHYYVRLASGEEMTGHIEGNPVNWNLARLNDPKRPVDKILFHPENKAEAHGSGKAGSHEEAHGSVVLERARIQKLESYGPWRSTFLALYFTMTALHLLHVAGGAVVMGYLWGPGSRMWASEPERFTNRVEVAGLFWHFVDLVWIFLFPVLYLI